MKAKEQGNKIFSKGLDDFFQSSAQLARFTVKALTEAFRPPFEFREILKQSYYIGLNSIVIIGVAGFILGLVLVLQSRPTMIKFGAASYLPAMSAISIMREVGPLVTALICAGKIGSGISAELGSMKVTEQIDAMEVAGANPFKYLVVTRIIAATFMIPVLTVYSEAIGLMGAFIGQNINDPMNMTFYFNRVFSSLDFTDVLPSFIKTFFFGFAIGLVGCTKGYFSTKGTEGVGQAANSAVVVAMLSVIVIDMVGTMISGMLGYL